MTTPNDDINGSTQPEVLARALSGDMARAAGGDVADAPVVEATPAPVTAKY